MPTVLHLKPEEIDTTQKRGTYTVSVIGCGQKGVLYATAFAEAGFKVICTDADQSLVKRLEKGKTAFPESETESRVKDFMKSGQLSATSELKNSVSKSDIIVMTIAPKIDAKKTPDYSEIENSCKQAGTALHKGALFIYGGIAGFGFTEGVIKENLENTSGLKVGEDFGLAYVSIQITEGDPATSIADREIKVAAIDKASLDAASTVLGAITKKTVKQTLNVKAAELAALFSAAKRDASTALANELAVFCENAGMDYFETLKLSDLHGASYFPTIAEEDNRNEAIILLENADSVNAKLRLLALARQINEDMVRHAVNLTQDTLRSCGKTLRRARVAVLGSAKPKTAEESFVKMLEAKGAKISLFDPMFSKNELSDAPRTVKGSLNEAVEGTDCIVILTEHDQFKRLNLKKLQAVMKMPVALIDLTGVIEPQKVEKEGFTYQGLGRGIRKK